MRHAETLWDLKYIERLPATIGDSERHTGTPWNWKRQCETYKNTMAQSEGQTATIGDCERYAATLWNWKRQLETCNNSIELGNNVRDSLQQLETCRNSMGPDGL